MTPLSRHRSSRRLLLASLSLVAAAGLAGCGVEAQSSPEALDAKSIPYDLLRHQAPTEPSAPRNGVTASVTLWLEGSNQHLVPVLADVPWPSTIGALLNALAEGPTEQESERGLLSPASSVGPLTSGHVRRGVVPVDLPASFENLGGSDQLIAVAQIVYTLTAFPGVKGVSILVAGQRAQVPNANGKLVAGGLTRSDYSALVR